MAKALQKFTDAFPRMFASAVDAFGIKPPAHGSGDAPPRKRQRTESEGESVFDETPKPGGEYREKLRGVREYVGLETIDYTDSIPGALSAKPVQKLTKMTLPAAETLVNKSDRYSKVLAGLTAPEGKQNIGSYQIGSYAPVYTPNMTSYTIDDNPWSELALPVTSELGGKTHSLFSSRPSSYSVGEAEIQRLETAGRRSLSVINFLDYFTHVVQGKINGVLEFVLQHTDEHGEFAIDAFQLSDLTETLQQVQGLLESNGSSISHLSSTTSDVLGLHVTLRRDAWLGCMAEDVPATEKLRLRYLSTNTKVLFPEAELEATKAKVREVRNEDVQVKMIQIASTMASNANRFRPVPANKEPGTGYSRGNNSQRPGRGGSRGGGQAGRGGTRGRGGARGRGTGRGTGTGSFYRGGGARGRGQSTRGAPTDAKRGN